MCNTNNTIMQIIFDNFPYLNRAHGVHVWNYTDNKPLLWSDVTNYINERTNVPLHYLQILDQSNGLSSRITLDAENKSPVNLDHFKSTYTSGDRKYFDIWFKIYLNLFAKSK